jgi:predicted PurR-regulated permease PerM
MVKGGRACGWGVELVARVVYNTSMERNRVLTVSSVIMAVFVAGFVLRLAQPVFFPFFLAVFLYFVLSPVFNFLTKLKIPRAMAVLIIVALTFFVIYLLGLLIYSSGAVFAEELPTYLQKFTDLLNELQTELKLPQTNVDPLGWLKGLDMKQVGSLFISSAGTVLSFLSTVFLVLLFLVFMLAGKGKLKAKIKVSFENLQAVQLTCMLDKIDREIQKYLAIKTATCLLTGFLAFIILVLFGVRSAIIFGFITFLLNYIPTIGAIIAKILPFIFTLLQFNSFLRAIWLLVVLFILDAFIGSILEPRLMGRGLGLSPLAILFALFFWGWLWGIPGMLLAVPMMVIMKSIADNVPSLKFIGALLSK